MWFPAVFLTDDRVTWEAVDETTALLHVPFEQDRDSFTVHFDPNTGYIDSMEALRYKEADSTEKTVWISDAIEWGTIDNQKVMTVGSAIWQDDGKPWAVFTVESLIINYDVREYIRAEGP